MDEAAEIAINNLSRSQRWFLSGELDGVTLISPTGSRGIHSTAKRLVSKGLTNKFWAAGGFYYSELTPLGFAVCAALKEQK